MKITLYKNCILNSSYNEVFYNKNILSDYLNTLQYKEISINDIYPKLNGNIIISNVNLLDAYSYNYIKIESKNNIAFLFITSIYLYNNSAILYYQMDVWSTFFDKWNLRKSLLTSTRYPKIYNCDFANIRIKYINNGNIERTRLCSDKYSLIVSIRIYTTSQEGNQTYQSYYTGVVKGINPDSNEGLFSNCIRKIRKLIFNQTSGKVKSLALRYNYEIDNIYIIPQDFGIESTTTAKRIIVNEDDEEILEFLYTADDPATNMHYVEKKFDIPAEPYIYGAGLETCITEIQFNNNIHSIYVRTHISYESINIEFVVDGKVCNVTDLFEIEFPYNSLLSNEAQLKKLVREQKNVKLGLSIASGVLSLGANVALSGGNIAGNFMSITKGGRYMPSESIGLKSTDSIPTIASDIKNIGSGISDLIVNNAPLYEVGYSTNNIPSQLINAYYGLCYYSLINIINNNQVNENIEETGYEVNKIINEIKNINSDSKFDIIKFGFVRIEGLTKEINDILKTILLDGTKIWYTVNINE